MRLASYLGLCLLAACGGTIVDSPTDGGADGGADGPTTTDAASSDASSDDGGTTSSGACPATAPTEGASCGSPGQQCEYGAQFWAQCDDVFLCDPQAGAWKARPKDLSFCQGGSQGCPATFQEANGTCAPPMECDYPEGHCDCVVTCGGPPGGPEKYFACSHPYPGCPYPRPRLGSACTTEGQQCNYQVCCAGTNMTCKGGLWQGVVLSAGCP